MKTARIVVLTIALSAGGVAAYLVSGSDNKPVPTEPAAQLRTVDVLVAKSDIGLGQTVTPDDMQWQTWPAATASNTFIRRAFHLYSLVLIPGPLFRLMEHASGGRRRFRRGPNFYFNMVHIDSSLRVRIWDSLRPISR